MTSDSDDKHGVAEPSLADRLSVIERFELELMQRFASDFRRNLTFYQSDMFMMGALRRTLAQAKGFRSLVSAKNFPCAAGLLRMQIDTTMRVNALRLVENRDTFCKAIFEGARFNKLKDAAGNKLTDAYLREKLVADQPWVNAVYEQTSDFIHLSGRHFYNSVSRLDDATRTVYLLIGGDDPVRPESDYYEIVDAFLEATRLAGLLMLGYAQSRPTLVKDTDSAV